MLSQKTSPTMDQKPQRHHFRQQSIPAQFEAHQHLPQTFPAYHPQYTQQLHRRGISLDQQAMPQQYHQMVSPQIKQEDYERQQVGFTNPGQHHPQHYTQVAQQRPQARPGQPEHTTQPHSLPNQLKTSQRSELEHIKSLLQQERSKTQRLEHTLLYAPWDASFAQPMERSKSDQGPYVAPAPEYGAIMMPNGLLAPPNLQAHEQVRRPSSSGSDVTGFGASISQHYHWQTQMQRASTPTERSSTTPMTPQQSPFAIHRPAVLPQRITNPRHTEEMDTDATFKASRSPTKQPALASIFEAESTPECLDAGATVKCHGRPASPRGLPHSDLFEAQATHGSNEFLLSPPNTAPLRHSRHFDAAVMPVAMGTSGGQLLYRQITPAPYESAVPTSASASLRGSPSSRSHYGGDVAPMMPMEGELVRLSPTHDQSDMMHYDSDSESAVAYSTHSRDMSLTSLNLDAVVQETGISNDEVQSYISPPDQDGKWTCLYPGCNKVHGRKENVRAHVQTHLGDRQWKCIHCGKDFVRPHDLKRHAKVHTGSKPHPCPCGHSFARHDALTRHKQRNICCGGIGGVVKKTTKRGRPRKQRPEDDERANKAANTRKRVATKQEAAASESGASASSQYTGSRFGSPESFVFDSAEYRPAQAGAFEGGQFDLASFSRAASDSLFGTPPMSPQNAATSNSPAQAQSTTSGRSPASIYHDSVYDSPQLPVHGSPSSQGSHSHFDSVASSPPELSHSSPPESAKLPDFSFDDFVNNDMNETDGQQSPTFEECYASSPEDMFGNDPWRDDGLFEFNETSNTRNFSDSKFAASFDDDMLFSDAANNDFF